jgi:FHA domain
MFLSFTSEGQEERVEIRSERLTIGRVADNDLQLAGEKVSRHHAVIEIGDGGAVVLRDLGSRNGVFVDGQRLSGPRVLSGGEQLRIGDQQLRVEGAAAARARRGLPVLALAAALVLVLVFGVGQLVLPGLAEQHLRTQLAQHGRVREVRIESVPAIKLLWHRADSVKVVMDSYSSEGSGHGGSLADFLSRTRDTGELDVSVGTLHSHLLTLHEVRLHKQGDLLLGQAVLSQQDLAAALPGFIHLRPVSASDTGIVVRAGAQILGRAVAVRLMVTADGGRVVVRPEGIPFGFLATIGVFDDPRIYVESLGAELNGEQYLLRARARLR